MSGIRKAFLSLSLTFFMVIPVSIFAADLNLSSNGKKAVFIELFTSQGCSSCPPAEEYINGLINREDLWSKYIPVVFHVDYWDYIGWKDVFSQPAFPKRQRRYANLRHVRTVYTPAFVVNGEGWRRGFFNSTPQAAGLDTGELTISVKGNKVSANYKVTSLKAENLNINIAVLGTGMVVNILAGENEGRLSNHNFVVLGYKKQLSKNKKWELRLPITKKADSKRYAFVAWVSRKNDPTPLQAVGAWLKNPK